MISVLVWLKQNVSGNLVASVLAWSFVVIRNEILHKRLAERNKRMALTADEKALLARLTAKEEEPEAGPQYDSIEKILEYLVRTSSHFSANPTDRDEMLSFLDGLINPGSASPTPEPTE